MLKPVKTLTLAEILSTLSGGESAQEVRDAIAVVSKKVDSTGKKGSVTIKLEFKKLACGQVMIKDEVKTVEPKADKDSSMFFVTDTGDLSRNDPNQMVLGGVEA